jgi:uncharacterized protein
MTNPVPAGGATGLNLLTWCFTTIFADGKMRAIFSMAFGASVYLLVDRLSHKGAAADAADIHYRRMLWLLLFGLLHAYLVWHGHILFYYVCDGSGALPAAQAFSPYSVDRCRHHVAGHSWQRSSRPPP